MTERVVLVKVADRLRTLLNHQFHDTSIGPTFDISVAEGSVISNGINEVTPSCLPGRHRARGK